MTTHLGGYKSGPIGDEATYFPDLWDWAVHTLDIHSVLDVGCGEGHALRFFRDELGCNVLGIDGVAQDDHDIVLHDFTTGPFAEQHYPGIYRDLVWSCEFVEHVDERYANNLAQTFRFAGKYIFLTHAFPGQGGHHHVNCRDSSYWIGFFAAIGFLVNWELTNESKSVAAANMSPWNHWLRSGLVLQRTT